MKRVFGLMFSLTVVTGGAMVGFAQEPPPHMPPPGGFGSPGGGQMRMQFQMPAFAELDKNKDKKLSRDEMPAQFPAQVFDRVDTNRDGFVDEEEWNGMRSRFGGGAGGGGARVGESLTKLLDGNADAKVSREEFARILSLFDALDKDHNGELTAEELNPFFRAVNEAQTQATGGVEVNNLFEKFDKNEDGKISAEEMGNEKTFKALDLNKDGFTTREEADTALKQLKKASDVKKAQAQPSND
ncbi:MAG: EF-hand domain-containing protein [Blastocatellia bacterium]